jgi:hypothetical protein
MIVYPVSICRLHLKDLQIYKKMKGSPGATAKLLPCDHEVMGSSPGNSLLQKCRERLYIRTKVVGPFLGPYVSGSYVHRAAILHIYKNIDVSR